MGNSTRTLQQIVDYVATIGDLAPVTPAGGYTALLAIGLANDVMSEMIAQRFNWKWNRIQCPPFITNSWQQDYATPQTNIGWIEDANWVDINNPQLPKPMDWIEVRRDLQRTSNAAGKPQQVCWLPNDQLLQDVWPGAGVVIANPLGAATTPANPIINIRDANGNILVLTTFGTTGSVAPAAAVNASAGTTVTDGTCVWTVVDAKAQGFRIFPLPPQSGPAYQVNVMAQARAVRFGSMGQTLDPIPDDYSHHFEAGFIAYAHRHSANPSVRNRFQEYRRVWLETLEKAAAQGDRERDEAGFVPDRTLFTDTAYSQPIGPANPFGPY